MTQNTLAPKLYQYEVCPFCWKVRVGLGLKKAAFEKIEVHPLNKKEISFSDYKKVPIYVDSHSKQINDSNKILQHLDEEFSSGPQLVSKDPAVKAEQDKWLEWSEKYVKAVPPLIYDTLPNALKAFDYITKVGNFSALQKMTIKYSGAFVMKMVAKKTKAAQGITDPAQYMKKFVTEWVEMGLGTKHFRGGENPDITDAAVFGISLSMKGLPAFKILQEEPAFNSWMQRMSQATSIAV